MAIVEITARDFRDKQASVFDLADKGKKIIIRRGKKKAYTLVPVNNEDLFFTPEMLQKIDNAIEQVKTGDVHVYDEKMEKELFEDIL